MQNDITVSLSREERCFFRDQLRAARAQALLNAEGFGSIVTAVERLGSALLPKARGLAKFREPLLLIAARSPASEVSAAERNHLTPAPVLFELIRRGRNDAVHQGAHARHLVRHCVEFALLMEAGLMSDSECVADFMVRDPICAERWHQVAFARQQMLLNSFSSLPIKIEGSWKLLFDHAIASYLAKAVDPRDALSIRIEDACNDGPLVLVDARVIEPTTLVRDVACKADRDPLLVVSGGQLLGIITPFDLL